jgi:membrane-associated phospholipid phosphatase
MMIPVLLAVLAGPPSGIRPQTQTPPADTSFARLPARLGHDFRRLATRTPLIVLTAGGAAAAAAHPGDEASVRSLSTSTAMDRVLEAGTVAGDGVIQGGAAAAIYFAGLASGSRRTQELGTALVEAQIVEGVLTVGLKQAVHRMRPDGGRHSFPSGHSSAAFATADVLWQRFGWKAGLPAYAGAGYIAASRLAERAHFLSDVVFGAAIGVASARSLSFHAGTRSVTAMPIPLRGGGAIMFSVLAQAQAPPQPPLRPPDVFYVPTPQGVVDAMLKMAHVTDKDVVYDLGCGDGRIPITAAKTYGARGVGIDIDPRRSAEATENAKAAGVTDKVRFLTQDLFESDIHEATVVTLYLLPSLNEKLMPKLKRELKPGTRVVSHAFDMGIFWPPDERGEAEGKSYYLWIIK